MPGHNQKLVEKHGLDYKILYDQENQYAQQLDLVHGFSDELKQVYLDLGVDLNEYNGDNSWTLPMPARIVVDRNHSIVSFQAAADYKQRPDPEDTLVQISKLHSGRLT